VATDDQMPSVTDDEGPMLAVNHPIRRVILRLFADMREHRTLAALSPKDVADGLELPLSNVSYHMRQLRSSGAIKLVGTEQVRGSIRHEYKSDVLLRHSWVRDLLKVMEKQDRSTLEALRTP
jgi:DNA-binding transcriptional ArsR family regulator